MAQTGSSGTFKVGALLVSKLGVVQASGSGAPVDGTAGTLAGKAALACEYIDRVTGFPWTNIGTKASPKWSVLCFTQRFAITSANLLGMFAAPVVLLAAPGANRLIVIDSILFTMIPTATQYASGGVVTFPYHGTATATHTGNIAAAVVNAALPLSITELGPLAGAGGTTFTADVNLGVDITNATGAFTTGTGTAVVYITFGIVPTN